jgi:hypothetical protein
MRGLIRYNTSDTSIHGVAAQVTVELVKLKDITRELIFTEQTSPLAYGESKHRRSLLTGLLWLGVLWNHGLLPEHRGLSAVPLLAHSPMLVLMCADGWLASGAAVVDLVTNTKLVDPIDTFIASDTNIQWSDVTQ